MQQDDAVDGISRLGIKDNSHDGTQDRLAAARIAAEASTWARRGVQDVTAQFTAAARELSPGELVKDDFFTLFESVSALEIMDPKMDSGHVPPGDGGITYDVTTGLSPEEALGVIDQLICLEMAWLSGQPLSQTLFTSLHIEHLLSLRKGEPYTFGKLDDVRVQSDIRYGMLQEVVRKYCIATIKAIAVIRETIMASVFYEEEDFVPHLYGHEENLLSHVSNEDAMSLLNSAHRYLESKEGQLGVDVARSLQQRFVIRGVVFNDIRSISGAYALATPLLASIDSTHRLAVPVPAAFSAKVQRSLATSTPPRPMSNYKWDVAIQDFKKQCNDIGSKIPSLTTDFVCENPHALRRAVWAFADLNPSTYSRAIMQAILAGQDETRPVSFTDLCLLDIHSAIGHADDRISPSFFEIEAPSDWRHQCARVLEDFVSHETLDLYYELFSRICQNRCRIRRYLTQAIQQWDALETLATKADMELARLRDPPLIQTWQGAMDIALRRSEKNDADTATVGNTLEEVGPFLHWTQMHKIELVELHALMGFETDTYLPDELGQMYMYLVKMRSVRLGMLLQVQPPDGAAAKVMYCANAITMALATYCGNLLSLGIIPSHPRTFANPQLLFEARLKPYLTIKFPNQPKVKDFERDRSSPYEPNRVEKLVVRARKNIDILKKCRVEEVQCMGTEAQWKDELKGMQLVCIALDVNMAKLRKLASGTDDLAGLLTVTEYRKCNRWWVVPMIDEKSKEEGGQAA